MDRRILKPKKRQNDQNRPNRKRENSNFSSTAPRGFGVKRKCDDSDETSTKRSKQTENPQKAGSYSANERLKKYRQALDQKKNQIVTVHKALEVENEKNEVNLNDLESVNKLEGISSPKYNANNRLSLLRKKLEGEKKINEFNEVDKFNEVQIKQPLINDFADNTSDVELEEIHFDKKIINHCDVDEMEDMDWSPINEEELAADIKKLRDSLPSNPNPKFLNLSTPNSILPKTFSPEAPLHIVIDTNIFISHLNLIKDIASKHNKLKRKPIVYVPWMVFQELDYFKDGRGGARITQTAAKRAVAFINDMLTSKDKALKGQTVHEALSHDFTNSNADDNILFCCLKLQQDQFKIVLLSNDKNLRSKLLIHSIDAYSTETIMNILHDNNQNDLLNSNKIESLIKQEETQTQKVANIFTNACTEIVKKELEKAYGSTVYKIVPNPPWSLQECLTYIKRFWVPVFSLLITQKQCLKVVDDLLGYLKVHKSLQDNLSTNQQEEFVRLSLSLCVYFKNCLSPYEAIMKTCISKIQEILQ